MSELDNPAPPRILSAPLQTGTAVLPDGTPVVTIDDVRAGGRHVLTVTAAARLGVILIRLSEQAVTNAVMQRSLTEKGTPQEEALALVQAFQNIRAEMANEQGKKSIDELGYEKKKT